MIKLFLTSITVLFFTFLTFAQDTPEDQVIVDDLIVNGSACVGLDCINGENFGFNTLVLKENNTVLKFEDTSASASFPGNDWLLQANESSNGGLNMFAIIDETAGNRVFMIEAGAPVDALRIAPSGLVSIQGDLNLSTNKITNVVDPTAAQDAATKAYVDAAIASGGGSGGGVAGSDPAMDNVDLGENALGSNTTGEGNSAVGDNALASNTSGARNTAYGEEALFMNTTGNNNVAIGNRAMRSNIDGLQNTAVGMLSMEDNVSGRYNTAMGYESLLKGKTGNYNIAVGYRALLNNDGGGYNTAVGFGALKTNVTGTSLTGIGRGADVTMDGLINSVAIGRDAKVAATNNMRFGNTVVTNIEGQVAFTSVSDKKFKTNIEESTLGLEFIQQLNPVTYNMIDHGDIQYTGFIAQEVDQIITEMGREWSGVKRPANNTDHYGLRYAEFTVPLVNATQEQQVLIEELQVENEELKTKNEELENRLERIEQLLTQNSISPNIDLTLEGNQKKGSLSQNNPNPFISSTEIIAFIPQEIQDAQLIISDMNGNVLLNKIISERGQIQTTIHAKNLLSGMYTYL